MGYAVQIGNHQALFAFGFLAERHRAGHFRQHAGVFGHARFKQFSHARQTARNIARFGGGLRNTRQHIALADFLPFAHLDNRANREGHAHRRLRARNQNWLAVFVQQFHRWAQQFAGAGAAFAVNHHQSGQARNIIGLAGNGNALFHVFKLHTTCVFGNHRMGVRVPSGQRCARFQLFSILHFQRCAVRDFVQLALATCRVQNHDFARAANHNQFAFIIGDVTHLPAKTHRAVRLGFHLACSRRTRCRATDVERTHRQLGARFADRLRRNHADCFARVHQFTARQIAPITFGTQAIAGLTGNRRAHFHFVHA